MAEFSTKTERMAISRARMNEHRAVWRAVGFMQNTYVVHEDDKNEIAALIEVIRWERMLTMLASPTNDVVEVAATRNMSKMITAEELTELNKAVSFDGVNKETRRRVLNLIASVNAYSSQSRINHAKAEIHGDEGAATKRDLAYGHAVVYANLASATFKYAWAIASVIPRVAGQQAASPPQGSKEGTAAVKELADYVFKGKTNG